MRTEMAGGALFVFPRTLGSPPADTKVCGGGGESESG
jgi:hypothetical protein